MRDLAILPKAHLHLHLEGAMRPATLVELAALAGVPVPETPGFGATADVATREALACDVLRTEADLRRLVDEVVADAAAAGAVWVEPTLHVPRHRDRFGSDEAVIEIVLDELSHAGCRHNIGTGLLVAADRALDPAEAVEQARLAVRYAADGVVSFGLGGDEAGFPPEPFVTAFDIALAGGLLSAPHAGERSGPGGVRGALEVLGAHRLAHGVRAAEDPDLVVLLADRGTCLDVCPSSNVLVGGYPSIDAHPLPDLLAAGVRCSLNADRPLLVGTGLLEEYARCRREMGLDDDQLALVARTSIEASGAPDALKARADNAVDTWLATDLDEASAVA